MSNYRVFFVLSIVFLSPQITFGQSYEISGNITDTTGFPVSYAMVFLRDRKDSAIIRLVLPDSLGHFFFKTDEVSGQMLYVKASGFYDWQRVLSDTGSQPLVYKIIMKEAPNVLGEVEIKAQKSLFERKDDGIVFNVSSAPELSGLNLIDILKQAPGVSVDGQDNVAVNGKAGVRFMIDGKLSYLSGDQFKSYLRSIQSANIRDIEIITNPSAKYDAAGTSGIIKVNLKKNTRQGLNGDVSLTYLQGIYGNYSGSFNLNYKKGGVNLYSSFSSYENIFMSDAKITRMIKEQPESLLMAGHNHVKTVSTGNTLKLGFDWDLGHHQLLGASVDGTLANYPGTVSGMTNVSLAASDDVDSSFSSDNNSATTFKNLNVNINYEKEIDTAGQKWAINYSYSLFDTHDRPDFVSEFYNHDGNRLREPELFKDRNGGKVNIHSAQADYTLPLSRLGTIETGVKVSLVHTDNDVQYSKMTGGVFTHDSVKSNHFIFDENMGAAYLNWHKEWKQFSFRMGLRGEQYFAKGSGKAGKTLIRRTKFHLFPSGSLRYSLNPDNKFSMTYSSRINRPGYHSLNPFEYYYDPYTYQLGNLYLLPELAHVFEVSYLFKKRYFLSYNVSLSHDYNYEVSVQNDSLRTLVYYPVNLDKVLVHALTATIPAAITKWWDFDGNFSFTYSTFKGVLNEQPLDNSLSNFSFNLSNRFRLPYDFSISVTAFYKAPSIRGIEYFEQVSNVSASVKKSLWEGKANIILAVRDIFKGQKYNVTADFDNLHLTSLQVYDSRRVTLTFAYNFSHGEPFKTRKIKPVNETERSRVD